MADDFDAIVVGAGMAGCPAAIRLAQGGANVLLVERGAEAGTKNLSGGLLWGNDLARILPNWWREMPVERHIVRKRFGVLTADSAASFDLEEGSWATEPYAAHTVLRSRTDSWLAKKAEEAGATVVASDNLFPIVANDGNAYSDETVPAMIASRSPALTPARSSAMRLASHATCTSDSPWRIA